MKKAALVLCLLALCGCGKEAALAPPKAPALHGPVQGEARSYK